MDSGPLADEAGRLVRRASYSTVATLFAQQVRINPDAVAVEDAERRYSYGELDERVRRMAGVLAGHGAGPGDCVAILSENRIEYLEAQLAAARLGAIVACQNWRLATPELTHCLDLVEPRVILVSPRHREAFAAAGRDGDAVIEFGPACEALLEATEPDAAERNIDPEEPLLILYTSGTTGLPKGAVLSHRAEIVRNLVIRAEFGITADDTFVAWPPLFHMGATEPSLGTLMSGGKVIVVDGYNPDHLARVIGEEELGWLLLMPGMVGAFNRDMKARNVKPKGVKLCGAMADLVPTAEIAEATALLNAPYCNTFGATETGAPPASSNLIPVGVAPERLSKRQTIGCEIKLVDENDREVPDGEPGELAIRGPTLFSGYWRAPETNAEDFRGGWFHMGDVFVRNPDGTLDFVDRVKYLIKSGGENVYPAEIERVLMREPRVEDVAVVRAKDARWGEVPVAFVARNDPSLSADELLAMCRSALAGYKQPKAIHFIDMADFPRSTSGKIQRHELESRLEQAGQDAS